MTRTAIYCVFVCLNLSGRSPAAVEFQIFIIVINIFHLSPKALIRTTKCEE